MELRFVDIDYNGEDDCKDRFIIKRLKYNNLTERINQIIEKYKENLFNNNSYKKVIETYNGYPLLHLSESNGIYNTIYYDDFTNIVGIVEYINDSYAVVKITDQNLRESVINNIKLEVSISLTYNEKLGIKNILFNIEENIGEE